MKVISNLDAKVLSDFWQSQTVQSVGDDVKRLFLFHGRYGFPLIRVYLRRLLQ